MSAGHDEHGHDAHAGHADLEKIVKLTDTVQGIHQSKLMQDFHDEAYILTSDLFKQHRRQKISGTELDHAADTVFDTLAKLVFKNEFKDGVALYSRMKSLGAAEETRTGESHHVFDSTVARLAGFSRDVVKQYLGSAELSPELMQNITHHFQQTYTSISQDRTLNSALKTNEDIALAVKYWQQVKKDPSLPAELKKAIGELPEDYTKTATPFMDGKQMIKQVYAALGSYKPQVGNAAHGAAHH